MYKKNPSFFKYIQLTIGLTLCVVIFSLMSLFVFFEKSRAVDIQKDMVKEQISLIMNVLDKYSITDQIDYLLKTTDSLEMVSGVALLDKNCVVLRSQPLNLRFPNPCRRESENTFAQFKIRGSTADSVAAPSWVVARLVPMPFLFTLKHALVIIGLMLLFLVFGYVVSFYIFKRTFLRPIKGVINKLKDGASFSSEISADLPEELIPAHEAICERDRELQEVSKKLVERAEFDVLQKISRQVLHDVKSPLVLLKKLVDEKSENQSSPFIAAAPKDLECIIGRLMKDSNELVEKIDLNKVVGEVKSAKLIEFSDKKIKIEINSTSENTFILANGNRLKTVVSNILNNAIQAMKNKKGTIVIDIFSDSQSVHLQIQDDGCGIAKNDVAKVLDRGVSIGKPYGQGLGLSDAKEYLEVMGGSIILKSEKNVGTMVLLTFPKYIEKLRTVGRAPFKNVLIDDYELIQNVCVRRANELKTSFAGMISPFEFDGFEKDVAKDANIFVDSIFDGLDVRGEDWAKTLFDKGYKNLYLCSTNDIDLKDYPWFKGAVRKQDLFETI